MANSPTTSPRRNPVIAATVPRAVEPTVPQESVTVVGNVTYEAERHRRAAPHGPAADGRACTTLRRSAMMVALSVLCISVGAGCGAGPSTSPQGAGRASPVGVAMSWFRAINGKDLSAAQGYFEPKDAGMMDWMNGQTSTWPTFSDVHCRLVSLARADASVYCTFHESQAPAVGNPDTFWTVGMQRGAGGPWLISGYGQG